MSTADREQQALQELLAERAIDGAAAVDAQDLAQRLAAQPEVDPELFDSVLGHLSSEAVGDGVPLPAALAHTLSVQGQAFVAQALPPQRFAPPPVDPHGRALRWAIAGTAACVLVLIGAIAWWAGPTLPGSAATAPGVARAELLRGDRDLVPVAWTRTDHPLATAVTGDVVWDNASQRGYMRFNGLPANDPGVAQYQLWIFDAERPAATPVDGGVFDIQSGDGMTVVPITARLPVSRPTLFAITAERAGGVVVSDRKDLLLSAEPR